jgi:hypothetical protein
MFNSIWAGPVSVLLLVFLGAGWGPPTVEAAADKEVPESAGETIQSVCTSIACGQATGWACILSETQITFEYCNTRPGGDPFEHECYLP